MSPVEIAAAAFILALLVQTGAMFYWGGTVKQMLRDHERRITHLEEGEA